MLHNIFISISVLKIEMISN